MIEFPITLTSGGSVCLPGHAFALALGYTKNRGVYHLHVDATGEWEGLAIRCFWHLPGGKDPASTLVKDGSVAVPASVTAQSGNGCITFEGSDGTRTVTSADLRYRVSANSGTEDGSMPEPGTPAWQELVDTVQTVATAAEQAKTDAQTAASEAATSATNAGQSAQQAADNLQELKNGIASGNFKGEKGDKGDTGLIGPQGETGPQGPTGATGSTGPQGETGPRGEQGPQGIQGDPGPAGADGKDAPQIDDTTVTDSAPWSSKHIIDTLCPPLDETGNPVVCYPVASYPLGVKASWEPTQEGTGDPSPENIRAIKGRDSVTVERCGGNVIEFLSTYDSSSGIKIAVDAEKNITLNGTLDGKGNISIGMCRLHWVAGKNYTMYVKKVGGSASLGSGDGITFAYSLFTTDYNHYFRSDTNSTNLDAYIARDVALVETELIFMLQCWRDGTKFDNYKFQIEVVEGTTASTTYTPYTGQTATLSLPRTIYGGEVDAVRGEGQETWKIIDLANAEISLFGINQHGIANFSLQTEFNNIHTVPGKTDYLTSSLPQDTAVFNDATKIGIMKANDSTFYIRLKETDANNEVTAKAYLASINAKLAYKLATPTPFIATGAQPIPALPGVNTLMTDADSVTVTGRADPIKRITDLEDAVASMTTT